MEAVARPLGVYGSGIAMQTAFFDGGGFLGGRGRDVLSAAAELREGRRVVDTIGKLVSLGNYKRRCTSEGTRCLLDLRISDTASLYIPLLLMTFLASPLVLKQV